MEAYQDALETTAPKAAQQGSGSVGALICDYLQSPAFTDLAPSSKVGAEHPAMANVTKSVRRPC
jgi:hypothetical protein